MSIFYILFVVTNYTMSVPPLVVALADSRASCEAEAARLTAEEPRVHSEQGRKAGAQFICFEGRAQ